MTTDQRMALNYAAGVGIVLLAVFLLSGGGDAAVTALLGWFE